MNNLPIARNNNIVVQESGKELLIYDLNTHKAYNLNETSSIVYQACNGKTTFVELIAKSNLNLDIIFLALDGLNKEKLLEGNQEYNSPFAGLSRREIIRKVGLASMVALPFISSLVAPTAAAAQSAGGCVNPGGRPAGVTANPGGGVCGSPDTALCTAGCNLSSGNCCSGNTTLGGSPCPNCTCLCA